MDDSEVFRSLGIALGLGLLIGLQRERGANHLAGVRTFPLITLVGCMSALLAQNFGVWIGAAALLAVVAVTISGHLVNMQRGDAEPGITTEIAIIFMFCIGALVVTGPTAVAVALGGGAAVLLHAKETLHGIARKLGEKDMRAIMQFALISLVVLPVLPDEPLGPFGTLNPHTIWLMVVLVVGIGLAGYLVYKFFGQNVGILAGSVLGGLISSTATTVSYARRAKEAPELLRAATVILVIACVIVYGRVLFEMSVVSNAMFNQAIAPMSVLAGVSLVFGLLLWIKVRKTKAELPEQSNPSELKEALIFGGLYAIVRLATAAGQHYLGESGLYAVALVSGLTDMDAITLSTARMVRDEVVSADVAWRVVMTASLANLVFKALLAGMLGGRRLFGRIAPIFGVSVVVGVVLIWLWP